MPDGVGQRGITEIGAPFKEVHVHRPVAVVLVLEHGLEHVPVGLETVEFELRADRRDRRATAWARSPPCAMTLATSESYEALTVLPDSIAPIDPESLALRPGDTPATVPGVGR